MPRKPSYYLGKMQELRDERGNRCQCGKQGCKRKGVEFAHVDITPLNGRGRGRANRYHDIRKHPERYLLMSRHCHAIQEMEMAAKRAAMGKVMQVREPGDDTGEEEQ